MLLHDAQTPAALLLLRLCHHLVIITITMAAVVQTAPGANGPRTATVDPIIMPPPRTTMVTIRMYPTVRLLLQPNLPTTTT